MTRIAAAVLLLGLLGVAGCGGDQQPEDAVEYVTSTGHPPEEVEAILQDLFRGTVVLKRLSPPTKEPDYGIHQPTYCQVAFGPTGAENRWIVRSGSTLAFDRDGDGDLAEEAFLAGSQGDDCLTFDAVVLKFGDVSYSVTCMFWSNDRAWIEVKDHGDRQWRAWGDHEGSLWFAQSPAGAPVVHFDGPLCVGIETQLAVVREKSRTYRIAAGVGCPGLGAGTFANLEYKAVPAEAKPEAIVTFPGPTEKDGPVTVSLLLKQRC